MAPLPLDHVDTDQIIPAEYLKTTSRRGLARGLFAGWRDGEATQPFVLDDWRFDEARILVAGDNFGCGSSREHAPWALLDYGFRAVIAPRFADIFRSNALRNGLLTVEVPAEIQKRLVAHAYEAPRATVHIDLEQQHLTAPWGQKVVFEIDSFARRCLLEGLDAMGYLLAQESEISAWEQRRPAPFDTRAVTGQSGGAST